MFSVQQLLESRRRTQPSQKTFFAIRTQALGKPLKTLCRPVAGERLQHRAIYYSRGEFMGRRVSIEVPGFEHDNPIPAACRVGPFLVSSGVSGKEPYTGKLPEGIDAQCDQMF